MVLSLPKAATFSQSSSCCADRNCTMILLLLLWTILYSSGLRPKEKFVQRKGLWTLCWEPFLYTVSPTNFDYVSCLEFNKKQPQTKCDYCLRNKRANWRLNLRIQTEQTKPGKSHPPWQQCWLWARRTVRWVFASFSCLICCPETQPQCRFLRQDVTVHGGFKSDQCEVLTKDTIKEENNTFKRKQEAWVKISISFITKLIIESCAVTH